MTKTRIAVLQMTSGIEPERNLDTILAAIERAAGEGAMMVFTPEMSGFLDRNRVRARETIRAEGDDPVLAGVCASAAAHGVWVSLGSLAIDRGDGAWANRSFVIGPDGGVRARYDKMHMFDVDLASGESWRESNAYRAGDDVVAVRDTPVGTLGLAICYDMRFPALFQTLGTQDCDAIAVPSSFTVPTGEAHWHVLLRARAIEASAFLIAAAQVGEHEDGRRTYGHSLVVDPWGEVLLDMGGDSADVGIADLDLARIAEVRAQVPSLANRREIVT